MTFTCYPNNGSGPQHPFLTLQVNFVMSQCENSISESTYDAATSGFGSAILIVTELIIFSVRYQLECSRSVSRWFVYDGDTSLGAYI